MTENLPIEHVLPDLISALRHHKRAVLQAPPGAGKTTQVPLALLEDGLCKGRILMLEPRRLATRAAAERMAQQIGETAGQSVGYRIRGQSAVTTNTRIEVVTEGILTRMLQSNPELPGVGAVIFDEFHERSLHADLGLALCLEVAEALRDDLILLAMSATLDATPVAEIMDAPIITSQGRSFPVTSHWLHRPVPKSERLEKAVAELTLKALQESTGSALVFLPGEGEIRRTQARLANQLPTDVALHPLYGALEFKDQRAAIAPSRKDRKVVLATSIAETSLTIEGIEIVIDAGLSRRSEFDPSSGMSRLITTRVSQAEAMQRAGRAGRLAAGQCYKLWTKGEDGALPAFPPAEIETGDLTSFALEVALWGGRVEDMRFVTAPHAGRLTEARSVLKMLDGLDEHGKITEHGRALARLPVHPRLAHMVVKGGELAPTLAALLSERDILKGGSVDLQLRLDALKAADPVHHQNAKAATIKRIRAEARRLKRFSDTNGPNDAAVLAAMAYPDRVGKRRSGDAPRFILSGGKGAVVPAQDALASCEYLVATDLDGDRRDATVRQAIPISRRDIEELFRDQIIERRFCAWSRRENRVQTRIQLCFGSIVLEDRNWKEAPSNEIALAMIEGIRDMGLNPTPAARRLMARAALMRRSDDSFADLSETALLDTATDWLAPFLQGVKSAENWKAFDITPALEGFIGWEAMQRLDRAVPAYFTTPLDRKIPIDYDEATPKIAVRLQEMFGVTRHPTSAGKPLQVTLLSPAQRPVQVTEDLPRFWATSYADVRKDMRGRYPKHPWPEDPTQANPTLRTKRRQ